MITTIFAFLILLFTLYSWINLIRDSKKLKLSGPVPFPFVGNANLFVGDNTRAYVVLGYLARKYNHAFRFYVFSSLYICLSHPKYAEPILTSTELIDKGRSYYLMRPWLGDGLLTSSGLKWKNQHKLISPAFHYSLLPQYLPVFLRNEKILRSKLSVVATGSPVNLTSLITAVTFDNVTETVIEISFDVQTKIESEYTKAVADVTDVISRRIRNPFLTDDFLFQFTPYKKKMDKALKILHDHSHKAIKSKRNELLICDTMKHNDNAEGVKNRTFLDLLLLPKAGGKEMDNDRIRAEVDTMMFAGHDTVSSAIMYSLYCMSNHKDVQQKVFEEQRKIFGNDMNRDPTYSDLQQMKYLDLVIKEGLRLYPSVPILERLIKKNIDIAGLHFPKDTHVFINIYEMHRNPDVFDDPCEFKPERFENNLKSHFAWIPFSAGPRKCIGQKYAIMEMKVVLSSIIKHFELLPSGIEPILCWDISMKSKNGVHVNILPRSL